MKTYIEIAKTLQRFGLNPDISKSYGGALDQVIKGAERYEKLRRLNVTEFSNLFELNLKGFNFDELIDELP